MRKAEYLSSLRKLLSALPNDELDDILMDYEEHFSIGLQEGKTEEEICKALSDPSEIAKEYLVGHSIDQAKEQRTYSSIVNVLGNIAALSFLNLFVVFVPMLVMVVVVIALYLAGVTLTISGIAAVVATIIDPYSERILFKMNMVTLICTGVFISSTGVLLIALTHTLNKKLFSTVLNYMEWSRKYFHRNRGRINE